MWACAQAEAWRVGRSGRIRRVSFECDSPRMSDRWLSCSGFGRRLGLHPGLPLLGKRADARTHPTLNFFQDARQREENGDALRNYSAKRKLRVKGHVTRQADRRDREDIGVRDSVRSYCVERRHFPISERFSNEEF